MGMEEETVKEENEEEVVVIMMRMENQACARFFQAKFMLLLSSTDLSRSTLRRLLTSLN
jgi:hypothetical protein